MIMIVCGPSRSYMRNHSTDKDVENKKREESGNGFKEIFDSEMRKGEETHG